MAREIRAADPFTGELLVAGSGGQLSPGAPFRAFEPTVTFRARSSPAVQEGEPDVRPRFFANFGYVDLFYTKERHLEDHDRHDALEVLERTPPLVA